MKKNFLLFLVLFLIFPNFAKSDSSKIYNEGYANPLNVLNSFLWDEKEAKVGLTSRINIKNRELKATIHPISLDSSKIKIAISKMKYITDDEKQLTDFIFNESNLDVLSKQASKGLLLANKNQDIIFEFINKKGRKENVTQGIIFAQKNSLNLVFFQIHGCNFQNSSYKRNKKKKKEFNKNQPNFSFVKKKKCIEKKKKVSVTSAKGIYKKSTNQYYSWIIFTPSSWQINQLK